MIKVKYNRRETVLHVKGHAGLAPAGKDIVCAGASTLTFTAVACAQDNQEKFMPSITQRDGEIRIACSPGKSYVTPCRRMMDTIFTGFEILASDYPDFVRAEKED